MKISKQGLTENNNAVSEVIVDGKNYVVFQDCETQNILSVQTGKLWFEPNKPMVKTILPNLKKAWLLSWAQNALITLPAECKDAIYTQPCNLAEEFPNLHARAVDNYWAAKCLTDEEC